MSLNIEFIHLNIKAIFFFAQATFWSEYNDSFGLNTMTLSICNYIIKVKFTLDLMAFICTNTHRFLKWHLYNGTYQTVETMIQENQQDSLLF